jgi:hypothetical protein
VPDGGSMIETGSLTKRYGCRALDGLSSTVQPGAVTGLVGLGFGAVILHTAGAIGALTAVAFVLPLIVVDPPKVRSARGNAVPPRSGRSQSAVAVKPAAYALSPCAGAKRVLALLSGRQGGGG